MNAGLPDLHSACIGLGGTSIYLGTEMNGVYRWNPASQVWDTAGLPNNTVFCLTYVGAKLMAGTWGGLYTSGDGGQTWATETDGLKPWLPVRAIGFGGGYLYAGLGGGGVWRATNPADVQSPESPGLSGEALDVRPNPISSGGRIIFQLSHAGAADLTIYDALVRRVATLVRENLPAGNHERVWNGRMEDGAAAPSGIYLVRLVTDDTEVTVKTLRLE